MSRSNTKAIDAKVKAEYENVLLKRLSFIRSMRNAWFRRASKSTGFRKEKARIKTAAYELLVNDLQVLLEKL